MSVTSIGLQIVWFGTLHVTGAFRAYTVKTLESWNSVAFREKREKKIFAKFRKPMKPLAIGVEGVMTFKRLTGIKFLRDTITGTIRARLTIGKSILLDSLSGAAV